MYVLVDFDNVPDLVRKNGTRYVADRVWSSLKLMAPLPLASLVRLEFRFYGGWLGTSSPTPKGSILLAQVQRDFPFVIRSTKPLTISGELAQALLPLPKHPLPHTFRQRQGTQNMRCVHPSKLGCSLSNCPIIAVHDFLTSGICPVAGCGRSANDFLRKSEQKLVDTMLVADLIHLSSTGFDQIAVVSSDDDLWPGMLMAMHNGANLFHVCTKYASTYKQYHGMIFGRYHHGRL
jgi:hypothetical protein